jgi:hypothetical protein
MIFQKNKKVYHNNPRIKISVARPLWSERSFFHENNLGFQKWTKINVHFQKTNLLFGKKMNFFHS